MTPTPVIRRSSVGLEILWLAPLGPLSNARRFQNGFLTTPKMPLYKPYVLNSSGNKYQKFFSFLSTHVISKMDSISSATWNELALQHKLLKDTEHLHKYQIDGANHIIAQLEDISISLLWVLPLLAQRRGISLVIVPFTSLGMQGENQHRNSSIKATFLSSTNSSPDILRNIAQGIGMHVVYACPEMLETPAVAQVLHSNSFQDQLSGVYIDEAHFIGSTVPLVALSATLPHQYQDSLVVYAGLRPEYHLINLGNFCPELSTVIKHMQHSVKSFLDLEFVIQLAKQLSMIIYYILHAGLSEKHHGCVRILLGSDKIGAGMDFPSVGLVIQYQCHGLSIVQWEQQKGRGAHQHGLTATGLILVEKSMAGELDSPIVRSPNLQDPGLLDLVQTQTYLQKYFHKGNVQNNVPPKEAEKIQDELLKWRLETWKSEWMDKWPDYGPESLVSTADLGEIS
ncbi:hypothetical protein BDQ17DRAFT_1393269 [Cyathus striatus]|nr:hypothetical protein BDQ17DRAFT_1393269 [Cyathus striatus]